MTEYAVSFTLKQQEVSAATADEAVAKAAQAITADLPANVTAVTVTKVDRIKLPGQR